MPLLAMCRDSIESSNKSPVAKSKHVTIETAETVDTDVIDDRQGKQRLNHRHVLNILD